MLPTKRFFAGAAFLALSVVISGNAVRAQTQVPAAPAAQASTGTPLSAGQLDALMAPIALYSDPLLAKVCIAATYPLEVVQAERWREAHASLSGTALDSALAKESWDQSIKGLVRVPTVLKMMSDQIDWTRKVGDAFLAQQSDVMASVQRLRTQAQSQGNLKTTPEQTVSTEDNAIVIEPVQAEQVYVPYYESSVYGPWAYPSYPPYYWGPPAGYGVAAGIGFLAGAAIAGGWWNNGFNWGGGNAYVSHHTSFNNFNNYNFNRNNGQRWGHNVEHRRGVGYGNNGLANRYGGRGPGNGANAGRNFGGFGNNHVSHHNGLGGRGSGIGNRGNYGGNAIGNRGGTGHRGNAIGNRGGNRSYGGMGHRGGGGHSFSGGGGRGGGMRGGGGRGGGRRR